MIYNEILSIVLMIDKISYELFVNKKINCKLDY